MFEFLSAAATDPVRAFVAGVSLAAFIVGALFPVVSFGMAVDWIKGR